MNGQLFPEKMNSGKHKMKTAWRERVLHCGKPLKVASGRMAALNHTNFIRLFSSRCFQMCPWNTPNQKWYADETKSVTFLKLYPTRVPRLQGWRVVPVGVFCSSTTYAEAFMIPRGWILVIWRFACLFREGHQQVDLSGFEWGVRGIEMTLLILWLFLG